MPFRNKELYNQENLNKIKDLRAQGFNLHDIDIYFHWPRGTSSYHLRKIAKAMKTVEGLNHPETMNSSRIENYTPKSKGISINAAEEKFPSQGMKQMSVPRKEWESLKIVVSKVGEVVSTKTNRSNAIAQVSTIRGILIGHDFLTRRK